MSDEYTLSELVEQVNKFLSDKELTITDSRQSDFLSERRVKDFATKGLMSKPIKNGRYVYYTEVHFNELIQIVQLRRKGFTDKSLHNLKTDSLEQTILSASISNQDSDKNDVLDIIGSIKNRDGDVGTSYKPLKKEELKSESVLKTLSVYSSSEKLSNKYDGAFLNEMSVSELRSKFKGFREIDEKKALWKANPEKVEKYKLSDGVELMVSESAKIENIEELLGEVRKILNKITK